METSKFGETAKGLARNPIGIIALFIVLVYGFASIVTGFASSFSKEEKAPLIYFLIAFPILVLIVFAWLVSKHNAKLFAPGDYRDESNFVKMQMLAAGSLSAAAAKNDNQTNADVESIVKTVQNIRPQMKENNTNWKKNILWVDDKHDNNNYERKAFEAIGLKFTLAENTNEAIELLSRNKFAAVISDMERKEGSSEGYLLLEKVRSDDKIRNVNADVPYFIYAGSNEAKYKLEMQRRGGQGTTNNAQELFEMVTKSLLNY